MVGRAPRETAADGVQGLARAAIAVALVLAAAASGAQPALSARKVALYFDASPGQAVPREDLVFLRETLLARLDREGLLILEPEDSVVAATDEARGQRAAERGADAWVRVVVAEAGATLSFGVTGRDLSVGGAAFTESRFERNRLRGIDGPFWDEVARAIASAFPQPGLEADAARVKKGGVIVKALAGTRVLGLGPMEVEIGADGTARVELTRPGFYRIEARRAGSVTLKELRYVAAEDSVVELAQAPASRWMFEGYTLNMSYLGGSAAEIFGPFYLRLGLTTYIFAPWLRNSGADDKEPALPLTDLVAAVGYQPLGPDAKVRPYLDLSVFVRIMSAGGSLAVEPVAPIGYRAAAGIEVRGEKRARAFADYGPAVYDVHGSDPSAVEAALTVNEERSSGYFYKPWWGGVFDGIMIDMVAFRVGVRWYR